jgi:hypothetical protein
MSVCILYYMFPRLLTNRLIQAIDHPPQYMNATLRAIAREQFLQIPGLGYAFPFCCPRGTLTYLYSGLKADKLLDQGCTGITDLRSRKFRYLITPTQRIYAKFFEHIEKPATREDAEIVVVSRVAGRLLVPCS